MNNLNWSYNAQDYNANNFKPISEGDHRVKISEVKYQTFSNGKPGFEITLDVSGYNSKLWHYITLDSVDVKKTNQRLGMFFNSFGITDYDLSHFENWVGKDGAVRVRHSSYNGSIRAQVAFCLNRKQQDRLPKWKTDSGTYNGTFDFCNSVKPAARIENQTMVFNGFDF